MISMCVEYLGVIPTVARGELMSVLQEKTQIDPKQVEQLFPIERAVDLMERNEHHRTQTQVREILRMIEIGSAAHNQTQSEQGIHKMEEALKKKSELKKEIDDFEKKQNQIIFGTIIFVALWAVGLCICCINRKSNKPKDPKPIEMTEAQKKKLDKLVTTLGRMDEEILKMKEELKQLKEK